MRKFEMKNITVNNTKVVNNGTIINGNVKLVAYSRENIKTIDPFDIIKSLNGYGTNVALTKTVHFNEKYPEYNNIYINNMRDKYAMVYGLKHERCSNDSGEWELRLHDEIIDDIYDTNRDYVEENLSEFVTKLDQSRIDSLKRWLDADTNDPDGPKIKKIKDKLKLLMYNQKDIVFKQMIKADVPLITEI